MKDSVMTLDIIINTEKIKKELNWVPNQDLESWAFIKQ